MISVRPCTRRSRTACVPPAGCSASPRFLILAGKNQAEPEPVLRVSVDFSIRQAQDPEPVEGHIVACRRYVLQFAAANPVPVAQPTLRLRNRPPPFAFRADY